VRTGSLWTIVLKGAVTKGGQDLDYPVPPRLCECIDQYLARFRPVIFDSHTHAGLWASAKGDPMKGGALYDAVCRRTKKAFGQPVCLHLFRDAAATFWSVEAPDAILGSRDLLGQQKLETTDRHYRHAQTIRAARQYAHLLEEKLASIPSRVSHLTRSLHN